MRKHEIDTPALLIDLDIMEMNISRMANYFRGVDADLRPHIKVHKTPTIAHKQLEAGAVGVTCAKLGEAEVMVESGIKSVLISNEVVGKSKVERLVNLARHGDVIVAVDNAQNVGNLSDLASSKGVALGAVVEVDIGLNRCGVSSGRQALRLAKGIVRSKGLRFRGVMGYEGALLQFPNSHERSEECGRRLRRLVETKNVIQKAGIDIEIVSAGGTRTYNIAGEYPGITEVQAGTYVFMDAQTKYGMQGFEEFDCAMSVLATVMSKPARDRAVVDAGLKAISPELGMPRIKDIEGVEYVHFYEEHGMLKLNKPSRKINVGDKLELIPSYASTTVNLYDNLKGIRRNMLETTWAISARGKTT